MHITVHADIHAEIHERTVTYSFYCTHVPLPTPARGVICIHSIPSSPSTATIPPGVLSHTFVPDTPSRLSNIVVREASHVNPHVGQGCACPFTSGTAMAPVHGPEARRPAVRCCMFPEQKRWRGAILARCVRPTWRPAAPRPENAESSGCDSDNMKSDLPAHNEFRSSMPAKGAKTTTLRWRRG
jgi:hypothetical protein